MKYHTSTKSKSTTLLRINNTPIMIAKNNMSKASFDKLKNSLKMPDSDANCIPEHTSTTSNSVIVDRNRQVINDSHYNHSTSYRYSDNDVEFDIECSSSNDVTIIVTLCANNSSVENPSALFDDQDDNDSQFKNIQINNLSDSEPEPGTSRRDTHSIDYEQIVFEQNTTPVPRRSILKSSNNDKPFRSESSGRKVRFAPLPKSDSRIKISKDRFNSRTNIVTDDKITEKKRVEKEKNGETSSNVSSRLNTRGRKRTAIDNSPKINISSMVVADSSHENSSPELKRTRNVGDIEVDNDLTSLTKKRVKKEKLGENSFKVPLYLNTRRHKQISETSIANGSTINISSKVVANSPQDNTSPEIKRTRNMSKSTAKVPDNQLPEIEDVGQVEMTKSIQKPNAKKRVHKFEALSNDSGQPARKRTRRVIEGNKETEMKINSFTRNTSKNNILSTDTKERLKKNEVKKSKSLNLSKKITRNTRQAALETTERFPSARVLRLRDKKK